MSRRNTADCVRKFRFRVQTERYSAMHVAVSLSAGAGIIIWFTCHNVNATLSKYNSKADLSQPEGQSLLAAVSHHASACEAWLPDLMKIKAWKSSASKCQTNITVVTQLSFDR